MDRSTKEVEAPSGTQYSFGWCDIERFQDAVVPKKDRKRFRKAMARAWRREDREAISRLVFRYS